MEHDVSKIPLCGDRILIRQVSHDDARYLLKWWNDPAIMTHVGFPTGLDIGKNEVLSLLDEVTDEKNRLLILDRSSGRPIGEMNFTIAGSGKASVGIKIGELAYQNKGYGKEAVKLLLDYLSRSRGIAQVSLDVRDDNFRAHRLYESVGFKNEGYVSEVGSAHGQTSNTRIYHYTWESHRDMSQESD